MKKLMILVVTGFLISLFSGCMTDADIASENLSKASEQFEIVRRVVFYNGITDKYILSVEGRCSVEFKPMKFEVVCKTGPGVSDVKKHYLGRADNVFPFIEQLETAKVNVYRYRVIFKPETIIPDIDFRTSS